MGTYIIRRGLNIWR